MLQTSVLFLNVLFQMCGLGKWPIASPAPEHVAIVLEDVQGLVVLLGGRCPVFGWLYFRETSWYVNVYFKLAQLCTRDFPYLSLFMGISHYYFVSLIILVYLSLFFVFFSLFFVCFSLFFGISHYFWVSLIIFCIFRIIFIGFSHYNERWDL